MDHNRDRPQLPGTTHTGTKGRKSVYTTRLPPNLNETRMSNTGGFDFKTMQANNNRAHLERHLTKMVAKLPSEVRDNVTSLMNIALTSSETIQKDLEISRSEVIALRKELSKKIDEGNTLKKCCELYQERVKNLEESVDSLKDTLDSKQKFSIKNKSAMSRLASTNRMLIDSLDALQNTSNIKTLKPRLGSPTNNTSSPVDMTPTPGRAGQLSPLTLKKVTKTTNNEEYEEAEHKYSMFQNDKLRESLLRVAREHYKSTKNSEILEAKVVELRGLLRAQEQQNRILKSELEDIRIIHNTEGVTQDDGKLTSGDVHIIQKAKNFGLIDDKFQSLIDRNAFDPIDGIQQLRRIVAHMATAPNDLNLVETIRHIVARESLRIFDADMISLYMLKPEREGYMLKYTVRSSEPMLVDLSTTKSLAAEIIQCGKASRVNMISNCPCYDPVIDGCQGVISKRILALPIYNPATTSVFGCIHITNKSRNNDVFSEIDELLGQIFADQASLLITSCVKYDKLTYHSHLLQALLEASTSLFSVIPETNSLAFNKTLEPGMVLHTLERLARELLVCPQTRAFLVSDFMGMPTGNLVLLERTSGSYAQKCNFEIKTAPLHSGIAGLVIKTRRMYQLEDPGFDPYLNPAMDLDPAISPFITVPIMDLYGTVVGCLQLGVGPRSPKLRPAADFDHKQILFPQAAQWLTHQVATPLQYLINSIGKVVQRPLSTPSIITRSADLVDNKTPKFFAEPVNPGSPVMTLIPTSPAPARPGELLVAVAFNSVASMRDLNTLGSLSEENHSIQGSLAPEPEDPAEDQDVDHNSEPGVSTADPAIKSKPENKTPTNLEIPKPVFEKPMIVPEDQKIETPLEPEDSVENPAEEELKPEAEIQSAKLNAPSLVEEMSLVGSEQKMEDENDLFSQGGASVGADSVPPKIDHGFEGTKLQEPKEHNEPDGSMKQLQIGLEEFSALKLQYMQAVEEIERLRTTVDEANKGLQRTNTECEEYKKKTSELEKTVETLQGELRSAVSTAEAAKLVDQVSENVSENMSSKNKSSVLLESEVARMKSMNDELKAELDSIKQSNGVATAEMDDLRNQYQSLMSTLEEERQSTEAVKSEIKELQGKNAEQQNQNETIQEQFTKILEEKNALVTQVESLSLAALATEKNVSKVSEADMEQLKNQLQAERTEKSLVEVQVGNLASQVAQLTKELAEKETVQTAMQAQLVRMAGENIKGLDSALNKVVEKTVTTEKQTVDENPPVETAEDLESLFDILSDDGTSKSPRAAPKAPTAASSAPNAASHGWSEQVDEDGDLYYFNSITGDSSWVKPEEMEGDTAKEPLKKGDWVQHFDDEGQEYWMNMVTGESEWELPN